MLFSRHKNLRLFGAAIALTLADYLFILIDCVISGHAVTRGEMTLSAFVLAMPIVSIVAGISWLLAGSTSVVYSRAVARGDRRQAAGLAGQSLIFSIVTGLLLVILMRAIEMPYLAFFSPGAEVGALVRDFFSGYQFVLPFQPLVFLLLCLIFVRGGELACIYAYCASTLVNAVSSYYLARHFGIIGIPLGTALGILTGIGILGIWAISPKNGTEFSFRYDPVLLFRSIRASLSDFLLWIVISLIYCAIAKYVLVFWDVESLAACAIVFCILRLSGFFAGLITALRPLEQRYATDPKEQHKILRLSRILASLVITLMFFSAAVFLVTPDLVSELFGIHSTDLLDGARWASRLTVLGAFLCGCAAMLTYKLRNDKFNGQGAPLNYLQRYALQRIEEDPNAEMFNLTKLFRLKKGIDLERLSEALLAASRAHASLGTVLRVNVDGIVVQRKELDPQQFTCPIISITKEKLFATIKKKIKTFKIYGHRLFQAEIYDCGDEAYLLSNFHHLICDGYSFPLLLEDARRAWNGEEIVPDKYYEVLAKREERSLLPMIAAERAFQRELMLKKPYTSLPRADFDFDPGYGVSDITLPIPDTFADFLAAHRVTRHHVFLTATVVALARLTKSDDLLIDWVFHGRISKDELRTVGAFMVDLPLIVNSARRMNPIDVLTLVKQMTFKGIKTANAYRTVEDCNPNGQDRLTFIYQDEWGELMSSGPVRPDGPYGWIIEETIPLAAPSAASENPFNVEIMEHRDSTRLFIEYDTGRYSPDTIHRYAQHYIAALQDILAN